MAHEFTSVRQIVEQGYCVSCGLCTAFTGGAAKMGYTKSGQYRPDVDAIPPDAEAKILTHCPGINLQGPWDVPLKQMHPIWGEIRTVCMGWASDPETRHRSSAGGVMTALNRFALESGQADFVLQVAADKDDALHSNPVIIRNPDELLTGSQSRYAPVAPLAAILDALDTGERFVVSLKPCDIAGVRNLQKTDERAREQIVFTQAMFCGTTPSRSETESFFHRRNTRPEDLVHMQWRGNGCPGKTMGTLPGGIEVEGPYSELWTDKWKTQFRCKICPDAIALQADIATGDIWPGGMPKGETPGENAIISHTKAGDDILHAAIKAGYLSVTDLTVDDVSDSQPHHVELRRTFGTRVQATTNAGHCAPNFTDLNEHTLTHTLDADERRRSHAGTQTRVKAGQGDECVDFDGFS